MKVSDIESVARVVLPKFNSSNLHPDTWHVISSCGERCVSTATPRIMIEPFLKEYLSVIGTEICTYKGLFLTQFTSQRRSLIRRPDSEIISPIKTVHLSRHPRMRPTTKFSKSNFTGRSITKFFFGIINYYSIRWDKCTSITDKNFFNRISLSYG